MSLESLWLWNCPGTHSLGFQSCPDDFSEMIYCDALFCPGCPRFVLLGLYHPSPAAINPPCLLLPIQRHILPSAQQREPGIKWLIGSSLLQIGGPGRKQERDEECWVHSLTWVVGTWEEKNKEWGGRGASNANRLYPLLGARESWKETLSYTLAVWLSCSVWHWDRQLVSPADEPSLIFQFWLYSLPPLGHLGSLWFKGGWLGLSGKRSVSCKNRKLNPKSVVWLVTQIWLAFLCSLGNLIMFSYILNGEDGPFSLHSFLCITQF